MTTDTRDGNGRFARSIDTAKRDGEAAALRCQGLTYDQIAGQLGYTDRSAARKAVDRALVGALREPADTLRTLEAERLDRLTREAWAVLERRHVMVSNGRVVRRRVDVEGGAEEPVYEDVLDDGPVLAAIDRLLKISERRAKLFGLDAPTRHEVIGLDAIDAEIARLEQELGHVGGDPA